MNIGPNPDGLSVLQPWVCKLPFMQQTVLLTAVRGPDNISKYDPVKFLLRWYRRCILVSSLNGTILPRPDTDGGGSFMGKSYVSPASATWQDEMHAQVDDYLRALDRLPHHFQMHFLHSAEIVGYKHPEAEIADFWRVTYLRLVSDMHLFPESMAKMDDRLGDNRDQWLARNDPATVD